MGLTDAGKRGKLHSSNEKGNWADVGTSWVKSNPVVGTGGVKRSKRLVEGMRLEKKQKISGS